MLSHLPRPPARPQNFQAALSQLMLPRGAHQLGSIEPYLRRQMTRQRHAWPGTPPLTL